MKSLTYITVFLFAFSCSSVHADVIAAIDYGVNASDLNVGFTFESDVEVVSGNEDRDAKLVNPTDGYSGGTGGAPLSAEADFGSMDNTDNWFGFGVYSRTGVNLPTNDLSKLSTTVNYWSEGVADSSASGTFALVFGYSDASPTTRFEFEVTHADGDSATNPAIFAGTLADALQTGTALTDTNSHS